MTHTITIARGDGIGPEIMAATLRILEAANAQLQYDEIEIGAKVYEQGNTSGIPDAAWETLRRNKILLKAPITTPQGKGCKSLNVTIRKTLGLYANVRPCKALYPFVPTHHPAMDLVIIRENEEGLYAGIEHRQTAHSYQCLKVFTRTGCERIIRFAFEYAKRFNRRRVTCMSKDNIMKLTDGLFHHVFDDIAKEYPGFETEHRIIDIGTALLATRPESFDVIVTSNLYGDIISDVAAEVAGSVGMAGSANIGDEFAMFEAIHGSAPDIAGKKIANPSGLLNGAIQMLIHLDQGEVAANIQNAWLKTLEAGIHTADIYNEHHSREKINTDEFADAVIAHLGQKPETFPSVSYQQQEKAVTKTTTQHKEVNKTLVGVDVFIDMQNMDLASLDKKVSSIKGPLALIVITNRGLKIWPDGPQDLWLSDASCCRFQASKDFSEVTPNQVLEQLNALQEAGLEFIKIENLYLFDGERGFSLAQGQ